MLFNQTWILYIARHLDRKSCGRHASLCTMADDEDAAWSVTGSTSIMRWRTLADAVTVTQKLHLRHHVRKILPRDPWQSSQHIWRLWKCLAGMILNLVGGQVSSRKLWQRAREPSWWRSVTGWRTRRGSPWISLRVAYWLQASLPPCISWVSGVFTSSLALHAGFRTKNWMPCVWTSVSL